MSDMDAKLISRIPVSYRRGAWFTFFCFFSFAAVILSTLSVFSETNLMVSEEVLTRSEASTRLIVQLIVAGMWLVGLSQLTKMKTRGLMAVGLLLVVTTLIVASTSWALPSPAWAGGQIVTFGAWIFRSFVRLFSSGFYIAPPKKTIWIIDTALYGAALAAVAKFKRHEMD